MIFVHNGVTSPIVLDEVQRAPDLFLAIKASVDRARRPGRFLLTGSANALLLPQRAEALARSTTSAATPATRSIWCWNRDRAPSPERLDALHVAVAAVHGVEYLLSWNCRHSANATIRRAIDKQ